MKVEIDFEYKGYYPIKGIDYYVIDTLDGDAIIIDDTPKPHNYSIILHENAIQKIAPPKVEVEYRKSIKDRMWKYYKIVVASDGNNDLPTTTEFIEKMISIDGIL